MTEYSFGPAKTNVGIQRQATIQEVTSASIGRLKDPLVYGFQVASQYGDSIPSTSFDRTLDPIFNPIKDELMQLNTEAEFKAAQTLYLKDLADRKSFQNATMGQIIIGEVANPVGWVPMIRAFKGASFFASAANLGLTSGAITATEEAARGATLPAYDPVEGAYNIAASTAMGTLFGGALYGAGAAVSNSRQRAHTRLNEHAHTIAEFEHFSKNEKVLAENLKNNRKFGDVNDDILRSRARNIMNTIGGLEKTIMQARAGKIGRDAFHRNNIAENAEKKISIELARRQEIMDELGKRRLDKGESSAHDPFQIASSLFDYIDVMPTPATTIYKYKIPLKASRASHSAITAFKKATAALSDDGSLLFAGHRMGMTLDRSVDTLSKMRKANLYEYESKLTELWRLETDAPKFAGNMVRTLTRSGPNRDAWLDGVVRKHIAQDASMTPREREAGELFYKFFDAFKRESEELGTLGQRKHLEAKIDYGNTRLKSAQESLERAERIAKEKGYTDNVNYWKSRIKNIEADIAELKASLEYVNSGVLKPLGDNEPYWHRQWDKDAVIADERGSKILRTKLTNWVRENPTGVEYDNASGLWKPVDLVGKLEAQDRYVDEVIKAITSDSDAANVSATGRSTRLPSRTISIPNSLVLDFINTNAFEVMRKYSQRAGSKNDFARVFGNRSFKEVTDELVDDLISTGMKVEKANELRKNFTILYQRRWRKSYKQCIKDYSR